MQSATSLCHCNSIACDSLHNPKPVGFQSSELENICWKERSHSANSFWTRPQKDYLLYYYSCVLEICCFIHVMGKKSIASQILLLINSMK